ATTPPPAKAPAAAPAPAPAAPKAVAAGAPAAIVNGPALSLLPAVAARPLLLASIAIPSIDRTLAGGTALVTLAVPLPLDGPAVKEMLLSQAGLPPEVGQSLDTASPTGAAVVALGQPDAPGGVGLVMAIPTKGAAEAERVIAALGLVISKRGDVLEIDNRSGGRGWVWRTGTVIVLSDSMQALQRGAMLALDARQGGAGEDVSALIYPDRLARANGVDLPSVLTALVAQAHAAQSAPPAQPGSDSGAARSGAAGDPSLDALEELVASLPDAETAEIGLGSDAQPGLVITVRLRARDGTPLGKVAAAAHP